ncbi:hypothetical protein ABPG72_003212 [Tetrahymena utriculariae]
MSRQNSFFSERDEDFFDEMVDNRSKLDSLGLYQPFSDKNNFNHCDSLKDSLIVAKHSINLILKNTEEVLYEKYLQNRKNDYSIAQSLTLGEIYINMAVKMVDREQEDEMDIKELEDIEPKKPTGESWIRSKIAIEHQQEFNKPDEAEALHKNDRVSDHTSITFKNKFIKKKEEAFKAEVPQPQNMEKPQEVDDIIERLRVIKQLETKRKEEKEEQEKKEKQNPLELKKEMKNSKYTYDFDGKVINTKVVKTEKLPPSNYQINYQFSTQEVDRNKIKKIKAQQEEQQKQAQLQLQQQQQQQQKGKGSFLNIPLQNNPNPNKDDQGLGVSKLQAGAKNPFSYDDFNPSQGVTLFYDQKIKEGPKSKEVFDTLANLDQRLKMHDEKIQITKSEYKRLTENGNLNMASTIKNMQDILSNQNGAPPLNRQTSLLNGQTQGRNSNIDNGSTFKQEAQKNQQQQNQQIINNLSLIDNQSAKNKQKSYFLSMLNHPQINSKGEKEDFLSYLENSKSKIIIKQPGLLTNIIVKDDEQQVIADKEKQNNTLKLPNINDKITLPQKSPVDEFNQSIIKGGNEWGKGNRGVGNLSSGKLIHKPSQKVYRTTLNQFYKLPRERDWGQSFKQSKSSKNILKTNNSENILTQSEVEFRGTFYTFNSKFSETLRSFKS